MPSISVIMPIYNAGAYLQRVLDPLVAEREAGTVLEIIAIDDGSSDDSAAICERNDIRVIPSGGRLGPGACRNMGVEVARGDVILLVDSDVICRPGVPEKIKAVFEREPDVVAVFGSYDAEPDARSWISTYRNLLHHYTHQNASEDASTFWAGLGAIRRQAYLDVGGFDVELFARPSIEDIELGYRLRAQGGKIRLQKDIQGTHLKRWTLRNMVHTDVFCRALPWARLLRTRKEAALDLNVSTGEQAKALLGCAFWASLLAAPFWLPALAISGALLLVAWAVNRRLFRIVRQRGGVGNMLAAVVLHQLYYLYSVGAFAWSRLTGLFERQPSGQGQPTTGSASPEEAG